jgi:hypothetical protein
MTVRNLSLLEESVESFYHAFSFADAGKGGKEGIGNAGRVECPWKFELTGYLPSPPGGRI